MPPRRRRYVLLDRDGTIIVEKDYLASADQLELLPNAAAGLHMLAEQGCGLIVVTNQAGVGRGYFSVETVEAVHLELERMLAVEGVKLDRIYYCPHAPDDECNCRKPKSELGLRAAADFGFDLAETFVIGDKVSDIEFGRRCGVRTILVRTGYGKDHEAAAQANAVADDLLAAAKLIADS